MKREQWQTFAAEVRTEIRAICPRGWRLVALWMLIGTFMELAACTSQAWVAAH